MTLKLISGFFKKSVVDAEDFTGSREADVISGGTVRCDESTPRTESVVGGELFFTGEMVSIDEIVLSGEMSGEF